MSRMRNETLGSRMFLILAGGRRSAACVWAASGRSGAKRQQNQSTRFFLTHRMHRFCCRSPADRGTSHAPTPSRQKRCCKRSRLLILAEGRRSDRGGAPPCPRSGAKRQQNQSTRSLPAPSRQKQYRAWHDLSPPGTNKAVPGMTCASSRQKRDRLFSSYGK